MRLFEVLFDFDTLEDNDLLTKQIIFNEGYMGKETLHHR